VSDEKKYYVFYKIEGSAMIHEAGPYPASDLDYQRNDIASYAGVYDVRTSMAPAPKAH